VAAIGVKELKARAGELVRRIEAGERILITKRGRPVAAMVPVEDPESFYDRVLEVVVAPSLKAAEKDLVAGRAVSLREWTKRRPRSRGKAVVRQAG
jgi:prevent-host-death family protein